jgi:hypothetical protein
VTGGSARHGRRDNGLYAADYAAVGDVDPRIGEHLLDVLGNRGIAAYLQPTADQHPITRVTTLPGRPTDRLFVDRSELDTAREFLTVLTRDMDLPAGIVEASAAADDTATPTTGGSSAPTTRASSEFEDAWASIVASFDRTTDTDTAPWPAIEDLSAQGTGPPAPPQAALPQQTPQEGPRDWPRWSPPTREDASLLDGLDTFGDGLPDDEDDEDEFVPPVPPPLPHLATITIVGILGVVAGIALIADPGLLPMESTTAAVFGCILILAGAIALIGRLRSGSDDDEPDDPSNGAVV